MCVLRTGGVPGPGQPVQTSAWSEFERSADQTASRWVVKEARNLADVAATAPGKTFRPFIPKGPRDVLQVDLIGPIRGCGTAENPGNRYAIIVVDLFTRKMWSAAIKEKTAAATWKGFKKMLDNKVFQGPHKMRKKWHLSSDNGKEFQAEFSTGLDSYSDESTIVQVFGVSGKSTNQAYVERSNQTVKSPVQTDGNTQEQVFYIVFAKGDAELQQWIPSCDPNDTGGSGQFE